MDVVIQWQKCEFEFQGEKVTVELRSLKRAAMVKIFPYIEKAPKQKTDTMKATDKEVYKLILDGWDLQALACEILPGHIQNIQGLTINGRPPTVEELADETVLSSFTIMVMGKLISISAITEQDGKNSEGLSNSGEGPDAISP